MSKEYEVGNAVVSWVDGVDPEDWRNMPDPDGDENDDALDMDDDSLPAPDWLIAMLGFDPDEDEEEEVENAFCPTGPGGGKDNSCGGNGSSKSTSDRLEVIKGDLANAAQKVYDEWDASDEEYGDSEVGFGGICQDIASKMADVIQSKMPDIDVIEVDNNGVGDQHVWLIAYNDKEAFEVDIPPNTYETGGGYSWKKIEGVEFTDRDVIVSPFDRELVDEYVDNAFCPTGKGGGKDPSCGKGGSSKSSGVSVKAVLDEIDRIDKPKVKSSKASDTVTMYHGTTDNVVQSILKEGFRAVEPGSAEGHYTDGVVQPRGVYCVKEVGEARRWAEGAKKSLIYDDLVKVTGTGKFENSVLEEMSGKYNVVLFKLRVPKDSLKKDPIISDAMYSPTSIPPEAIISVKIGSERWKGVKNGVVANIEMVTVYVPIVVADDETTENESSKHWYELIPNAFCPTGKGGGVDPTCGSGKGRIEPTNVTEFKQKGGTDAEIKSIHRLETKRYSTLKKMKATTDDAKKLELKSEYDKLTGELSAVKQSIRDRFKAGGVKTDPPKVEPPKPDPPKPPKKLRTTKTKVAGNGIPRTKEHIGKLTPDELEKISEDAGDVYMHGMSTYAHMRKIKVDGVDILYERTVEKNDAIGEPGYQGTETSMLFTLRNGIDVHDTLWKQNTRLVFTTQDNRNDARRRIEYNNPYFKSAATGGDGNIVVYGGGTLPTGSIAHESAHNMSTNIFGDTDPPISSTRSSYRNYGVPRSVKGSPVNLEGYSLSDRNDGEINPQTQRPFVKNAVTKYGRNNRAEDFAEFVAAYNDIFHGRKDSYREATRAKLEARPKTLRSVRLLLGDPVD